MEPDEIARRAKAAGLKLYWDAHQDQLASALRAAAELADRLPRDLGPGDEPAHVLRLPKIEGTP